MHFITTICYIFLKCLKYIIYYKILTIYSKSFGILSGSIIGSMSTVPWNAIYGGGSLDFGTKLVCACCVSVEQSGVGWSSLKPSSPLIGFVSEIRNVLKYHSSCSRRQRKRRDIPRTLPCSVDFSFPSLSSSSFLNLSISPCRPSWEHTLCMFFQLCISVCVILCVCSSENSVGLAWVWECMRSCREEMPSNGFRSLVDCVCDISCGGSLKVGSLDCTTWSFSSLLY